MVGAESLLGPWDLRIVGTFVLPQLEMEKAFVR